MSFASINDIVADIRAGKPVIVVDDENRENEGDLFIPASCATPEIINFMIRECGGLVCLAIEGAMAKRLDLPLQPRRNLIENQTYFTVSIDARHGVTTGISAKDRAHTIAVAIDPTSTPADICTPGHVFPLLAMEGGVLERAGHTEACVAFSRMAGLPPAAVICEIMNEDGSMARLPDLEKFAVRYNLKIITIESLINHERMRKAS